MSRGKSGKKEQQGDKEI